jgi:L-threonylcarbamoyladenylate synthase
MGAARVRLLRERPDGDPEDTVPGNLIPASEAAIERAARLLRAGALVAFPTETVYGLGGDATDEKVVARIFAAKGRPRFNPLIMHMPGLDEAEALAVFDDRARIAACRFWPGPLSLVLPRRPACGLSLLASAGLDTVALRVPSHPVARALLRAAGRPIAAPSANRSGRVSPTTAAHVAAEFFEDPYPPAAAAMGPPLSRNAGEGKNIVVAKPLSRNAGDGGEQSEPGEGFRVAMILDGGPCSLGVESSVLDLTRRVPVLLRPGGVTLEQLREIFSDIEIPPPGEDAPRSPGRLPSHYAPGLPVRLGAVSPRPGEALLAFGPVAPAGFADTLFLTRSGDLAEAAANLFALLRRLDRPEFTGIAVMPIPEAGLGRAINDRLRRAAAPR